MAETDVDENVIGDTESKSPVLIDPQREAENQLTDVRDQPTDDLLGDRVLAEAVQSNTHLLQQLLEQVSGLREVVLSGDDPIGPATQRDGTSAAGGEDSALVAECDQLRQRIAELEDEVSELRQQNGDLASRVASSNVHRTVSDASSGCNDALSWEDRKKLILQQMEEEAFDADTFVSSLQGESEEASENPSEFVRRLSAELESRCAELARRDEELQELRHLLDQQSGTREGGIAVGAAAIAEMIDADEFVQQERQRLQLLQEEWEEKFRQGEIEASLERAKLSRERQELAQKQSELEEQLAHIRRESRNTQETGASSSRRWLVKLGLSDDSG
jgi:DNA repair exonuclease SbcCD ATPase subunit